MSTIRSGTFDELDNHTLYSLLKLRVDVFVVEQECPYPELDGRDTDPSTRHFWADDMSAYLRVLDEADGEARIGRVVVRPDARGKGQAGQLLDAALNHIGERPCVLHAQAYLVDFYERYGFRPTGPEFLDDGIPHVPMRRQSPNALIKG